MKQFRKYFVYAVIVIPIITFFAFFFRYRVNAPINDDYVLLGFINNCVTTDSLTEKIKLFFAQHNEHRIVYDRIWTVLSYKINKNVNFNLLALVGNLSLLGIAYIFYKKFLVASKDILLFLPVTVLIFNLTSWENITFPMATLSNFSVYFFILLSLKYLTSDTLTNSKNLYFAFIFFVLAVFTQGGGLFLFPISILVLIYKKEYKNLAIYATLSLIIVLAYFYGYHNYGQNKGILETIVTYKFTIVQFCFAFLGNAFNYFRIFTNNTEQSINVTSVIGFCFFLIFIYITWTKYYKKNLFIYSLMTLIIASSFITAISRVSFGLETAAASRYRINGIMFAVTIYFWLVETYPLEKKKFLFPVIIASVLYFFGLNINQYEYLSIREKQTNVGILAFNSGEASLLNCDKLQIEINKNLLNDSKRLNTYNFPTNEDLSLQYPYSREIETNITASNTSRAMPFSVDIVQKTENDYYIDGWAFIDGTSTKGQKVYIGLKNKEDYFPKYFSTKQIERFDLNPYFKKKNLGSGGYIARIENKFIKPGETELYLIVLNEDEVVVNKTDKKIIR